MRMTIERQHEVEAKLQSMSADQRDRLLDFIQATLAYHDKSEPASKLLGRIRVMPEEDVTLFTDIMQMLH